MVQTPIKTMTLEEFLLLPETKPASEYIDGQVIQKPMPQGHHSIIQSRLGMELTLTLDRQGIAIIFPELRCVFGDRAVVPDLVVFEDDGNHPYGNAQQGECLNRTTPMGNFKANLFGLYDMHGNLWEWCLDEWINNYNDVFVDGSARGDFSSQNSLRNRPLRGGSWDSDANKRQALAVRQTTGLASNHCNRSTIRSHHHLRGCSIGYFHQIIAPIENHQPAPI
jgi:Sulfatase-modifying factor enzyme 1/Putative restriction endonuclease